MSTVTLDGGTVAVIILFQIIPKTTWNKVCQLNHGLCSMENRSGGCDGSGSRGFQFYMC